MSGGKIWLRLDEAEPYSPPASLQAMLQCGYTKDESSALSLVV